MEVRVKNINDYFTFALYGNVCRSLFERHKLHFAFLLCVRIQMNDELIDPAEWRFLLSGAKPPQVLNIKKKNTYTDVVLTARWIFIENYSRLMLTLNTYLQEEANPATNWLSQRSWMEIQSLQILAKFDGFVASFVKSIRQFKEIFDADQPET